jgi:hypothetical protein
MRLCIRKCSRKSDKKVLFIKKETNRKHQELILKPVAVLGTSEFSSVNVQEKLTKMLTTTSGKRAHSASITIKRTQQER